MSMQLGTIPTKTEDNAPAWALILEDAIMAVIPCVTRKQIRSKGRAGWSNTSGSTLARQVFIHVGREIGRGSISSDEIAAWLHISYSSVGAMRSMSRRKVALGERINYHDGRVVVNELYEDIINRVICQIAGPEYHEAWRDAA